jgi:phage minor structural protein
MKPILFSKNATSFLTNGLGRIDCISGEVVEERNGKFELKAVIPESGLHANEIEMDSILKVKPNDKASMQLFRVYKITKPINGKFEVYAAHISYQLRFIPVNPFEVAASPTACSTALSSLKSQSMQTNNFSFWTDVQTVANFGFKTPISVRNALGGVEGSILDRFGGEYEWDNFDVKLHRARGSIFPVMSLRYGKNIIDLKQEENIEQTITGVVPFWSNSDKTSVVMLPEKVVEISQASSFPYKRTVPLDLSQSFDDAPTESALRATAAAYLSQPGIGIPKVSIKVKFENIVDIPEYAQLQRVGLCDIVEVYFEKLGISATAKVIKYNYDFIREKYNSVEIGTLRDNLASVVTATNKLIEATLGEALKNASEEAKKATAWLTNSNGYVVAVKNNDGSWKELLFMNAPDMETATNVLRINENGIGFSTTGVHGIYRNAWTIDGHLLADFIDSGTLRGVEIIAGGTNNQSGTFRAKDASAQDVVVINKDGINIKKGTLDGATINVGKADNQAGVINMYDANNNKIGWWNNIQLNVGNGATVLSANGIGTKFLDCSSSNGEAWFPNGIFINRGGNGKFEGRSFAVNTWNNQNGGMIEAYQDGIITITRDLWVAGTILNSSDIRIKNDVQELKNSIELIKKMHPISFRTIDDPEHIRHGLIAQDFEVLSNYGEWQVWKKTDDGFQELGYMELIADIIKVEQELIEKIEEIERRLG